MTQNYNILMLTISGSGHLNPMLSLAYDLNKHKNVRVIFYGNMEHKELIEKTNSEFRNLELADIADLMNPNADRECFRFDLMLNYFMDSADKAIPFLMQVIEKEQIDLIVYDFATLHAKWLMKKLRKMYAEKKLNKKPPLAVPFYSSFVMDDKVLPMKDFRPKIKLTLLFVLRMILMVFRYFYFFWSHGLPVESLENLFSNKEELSICCITPEFHPKSYMYSKSVRFVGSCASEEFRLAKELDEPLRSFLAPFGPINPVPLDENLDLDRVKCRRPDNDLKLIYVSFGTIANQDESQYLNVINSVNLLDENNKTINKSQIRMLVSTGVKSYAKIMTLIERGEFAKPDNVLIMSRVPQLDVLKRASLFVTHCGQNSTSESIHYGVPMIGIPVHGDQPFVAKRMANELGLGKCLEYDQATPSAIRDAIVEVLGDEAYLERCSLQAKLSRKYNGTRDGAQLIVDYMGEKLKSKSD